MNKELKPFIERRVGLHKAGLKLKINMKLCGLI